MTGNSCVNRVLAAILVATVTGCGAADRAELRGTVTADGSPVDEGSIALTPIGDTKGPTFGGSIQSGAYRITHREGARPGTFRVKLHAGRKTGRMVKSPVPPFSDHEEIVDLVPPEFGAESTLEVEIKPGVNTFDIPLP